MSFPFETRLDSEIFWVDIYGHLLDKGYRLRARWHPDWSPSWILPDGSRRPGSLEAFEDAHVVLRKIGKLLDATRLSDGAEVVLRKADKSTSEYAIIAELSSTRHSMNQTVPLLDTIPVPGSESLVLLVIPRLMQLDFPHYERRFEAIDAILQILWGVAYMHQQNIAHGDISPFNIMYDASQICSEPHQFGRSHWAWNVRCRPRHTVGHVPYYFIDFENAKWFPGGRATARVDPDVRAALRYAPEMHQETELIDPFALDLFNVSVSLDAVFCDYDGLEDILELLGLFRVDDPASRPEAIDIVAILQDYVAINGEAWMKEPIRRVSYTFEDFGRPIRA